MSVEYGTIYAVPHTARRDPGRPPAAKSAHTRERIVDVAREVFSELGYDATTFQAIAARADLTRPAINHYFASKRLLYREVVEETNKKVIASGIERAQHATTLIGRLSAFIDVALQIDTEDRAAAAFLVTSVLESHRHPELRLIEHDSLLLSRAFLTWSVEEAIRDGEISTDVDVPSLVEMLTAVMWGVGFYASFLGDHQDLKAVTTNLHQLFTQKLWQLRPQATTDA